MKLRFWLFFILFIIYEEISFMFLTFGEISSSFLNIILFSLTFGLLIAFINSLFNRRGIKTTSYIFTISITLIYLIQFVYYKLFNTPISFYSTINIAIFDNFLLYFIKTLLVNCIGMLLISLPIFLLIFLSNNQIFSYNKRKRKEKITLFSLYILFQIFAVLVIWNSNHLKELCTKINEPKSNIKEMGVIPTIKIDIFRYITNFNESI